MAPSPRIVSLLPSATEIVCALGLQDRLVGRSHECDHPLGLDAVPVCSRPRLDVARSGTAIDREVRELVRQGLSVYEVREEVLRQLRPEVIVTQNQCEVCAVSEADVVSAVRDWTGTAPAVISLSPSRLEDVWTDVERVAEQLGLGARGRSLSAGLRDRVASIAARTSTLERRPRVACIEWIEPLMAAGNWMPELVTLAGGESLFGESGDHSPWLEWEALRAADPEVILLMPCGYGIGRTLAELAALTRRGGWSTLRAVTRGEVYAADGHHYFNRPGPRLVESLEILAEILHPRECSFGHRGQGWRRLEPGG
jgi:iron complex transport system substrate-binding protein